MDSLRVSKRSRNMASEPEAPRAAGRPLEPLARAFLQAYWRGDLADALARCTPTAVIELAPSLPMVTPAPMAEVLPQIFANVYPKFEGGRFDVTIGGTLEQGNRVLVEYTARGRLVK